MILALLHYVLHLNTVVLLYLDWICRWDMCMNTTALNLILIESSGNLINSLDGDAISIIHASAAQHLSQRVVVSDSEKIVAY